MTTNGHAIDPKPGDLTPAVRPVKRTLFVEEEDNGITSAWEATDEDLFEECKRRGILPASDEYAEGFDLEATCSPEEAGRRIAYAKAEREKMLNVVGTTPSGEAVRMVGAERAEVGKMPSARIGELYVEWNKRRIQPRLDLVAMGDDRWSALLDYLDEQAMKGPNR